MLQRHSRRMRNPQVYVSGKRPIWDKQSRVTKLGLTWCFCHVTFNRCMSYVPTPLYNSLCYIPIVTKLNQLCETMTYPFSPNQWVIMFYESCLLLVQVVVCSLAAQSTWLKLSRLDTTMILRCQSLFILCGHGPAGNNTTHIWKRYFQWVYAGKYVMPM